MKSIGATESCYLKDLTLTQMEDELKRVNDEIKRVYCSRSETENRSIKIGNLNQRREELTQGIKEIRSIPYSLIKGISIGVGVLSPA